MEQDIQNGMKRVSVNVGYMQVFVIINNIGMMINTGVNAKNQLIKVYTIKDIFEILVLVNGNVINHVMFMNIWIMKTIIAGKKQLINQLKNVKKTKKKKKEPKITLAEDENKHKCSSCTLHIALFSIIFTINVGIDTYFVYYKYMN